MFYQQVFLFRVTSKEIKCEAKKKYIVMGLGKVLS